MTVIIHLLSHEDGTDRVFRNVGIQNSGAGELPRRKHTTPVLSSRVKQFKKTTGPSKMGLICCLETSERNYQYVVSKRRKAITNILHGNIPEERGPQLHSGGSLKPRKLRGTVKLLLSGR